MNIIVRPVGIPKLLLTNDPMYLYYFRNQDGNIDSNLKRCLLVDLVENRKFSSNIELQNVWRKERRIHKC